MLDCHVHLQKHAVANDDFLAKQKQMKGDGAILLSLPPETFFTAGARYSAAQRLDHLLQWCAGVENLHPFFWLDPLAADAPAQLDAACACGVAGFKVICDRFYPSNERAMAVFALIAAKHKPILFHSGILWDGKVSSRYNRPLEFECLLEIPNLKFALAHVSWPWCDEAIALYGKFLNAHALNPDSSAEMYLDTTPGTPKIFRKDVLTKLYCVGYDVEDNVMFGSDSCAENYNADWTREWMAGDGGILREIGLSEAQIAKYFSGNAKRFVTAGAASRSKRAPLQGEGGQ